MIEFLGKVAFVGGHDDAALRSEALGGRNLMVVAGFAKFRAPGHDYYGLAEPQSGEFPASRG